MKQQENKHINHTNEHKMWFGNPNIGEKPYRMWGLCSTLFASVAKMQIQKKGHWL
jgi:hypothetical protein